MNNNPVTDLSYLREIAMGDEVIVIEAAETFLNDAPKALQDIQEYYQNKNWSALAKEAHKIKPNFSYMGMERARELIADIEKQAKSQKLSDDLDQKIQELHTLCSRAFDELNEKVDLIKERS